jgi:hypothetical protein
MAAWRKCPVCGVRFKPDRRRHWQKYDKPQCSIRARSRRHQAKIQRAMAALARWEAKQADRVQTKP